MNNSAKIQLVKAAVSWIIVFWICWVFLNSLPYKFTNHPDTQHIFGTIGGWMTGFLGAAIGGWFSAVGAKVVGTFELLTSATLLLPGLLWLVHRIGRREGNGNRVALHRIGGLMASAVMAGAVFFHLFTPLGVEVLHQGESDGGSLFYAALSILILGIVLFLLNPAQPNQRGGR